jgi:hypothetical protein
VIDPIVGSVLAGFVTIGWGIVVEKWFASKWTIFSNIVSLIFIIATIDVPVDFLPVMCFYLLASGLAIHLDARQGIKQALGSKSFGSFTVIIGLMQLGKIPLNAVALTVLWIVLSVVVYYVWHRYKNWH